jgi:YbbR domain-containing protein
MPQATHKFSQWLPRPLSRWARGDNSAWKTWGLRLLALGLAFLLFTISRQPTNEIRLAGVPVEYSGLAAGLELAGEIPQTVSVRLRGPRDVVRGLPPTQLSVEANLSNKAAGERSVQLRPTNVNLPEGVQVVRIEPSTLRLKLEPTLRRRVIVEPQITLPDEGVDVYQAKVEPSTVEIEGPTSQVSHINLVKTESVSLRGRQSSFSIPLEIELPNASLRLVDDPQIKLTVELGARRATRVFEDVPVQLLNAPSNVALSTKYLEVVLTGAPSDLAQLRSADVQAEIDLSKQPADLESIKPHIRLPAALEGRVSVKSTNPTEVQVKR